MRHKLSYWFYQLLIPLYGLGIRLAAIGSPKARAWIRGRKNPRRRPASWKNKKPVWFHAASTGEFEQGRPIIEHLRKKMPEVPILVTFFSPSGFHAAQKYADQLIIEYLPLDTHSKARKFIRKWQPILAVFIKYEVWPSYLTALHQKDIPTLIISSRWRPQQVYFRSGRSLFYPLLEKLDHIFVQDALSSDILAAEGLSKVTLAGDTRIDRVRAIAKKEFSHPILSSLDSEESVLILGSSWPSGENLLFEALKDDKWPSFDRILIVPHELSEAHIRSLEKKAPLPSCTVSGNVPDSNAKIIIVNEMGVLAYLYRRADLVYVGGGFGVGIHSILEAAVYGKPVLFGPRHHKFKEAQDLLRLGAASVVQTKEDWVAAARRFRDPKAQKEVKQVLTTYFEEQSGASHLISDYIIHRLKKEDETYP